MHGGEEVKNLGDGLMVAFASAIDALALRDHDRAGRPSCTRQWRAGVRGPGRPERRRADPRRGRLLWHAGGDRQATLRRQRARSDPRLGASAWTCRDARRVHIPCAGGGCAEGRQPSRFPLARWPGSPLPSSVSHCQRCWPRGARQVHRPLLCHGRTGDDVGAVREQGLRVVALAGSPGSARRGGGPVRARRA